MRKSLRNQLYFGTLGTLAWPPIVLTLIGWPAYAPIPALLLAMLYLLTALGFTLGKQTEVYSRRDLWLRYAGFLVVAGLIVIGTHYALGIPLDRWITGAGRVLFFVAWFIDVALLVPLLSGFIQMIIPEERRDRGRTKKSIEEVQQRVELLQESATETIRVAGFDIDRISNPPHWLVLGATRTGKSLTLEQLYQSVIPTITSGSDRRALIHDPKGNLVSRIAGMHPQVVTILMNPMDIRGYAWDIATDINEPVLCDELASILIPDKKGDANSFFSNNARLLVAAVIYVLIVRCPGTWELWHVIMISTNLHRLRFVLGQTPETAELLENFKREETFQDILSTVFSEVGKYKTLATLWRGLPKYSLQEWLTSEAIIILSADPKVQEQMRNMAKLLIKRLSQMINGQEDSKTRATWLFLDEARLMPKLDGLAEAMLFGGSKGLHVVLAYQDHDGWCEVYGTKVGNEMANQCGNLMCMKLDSPSSAEYVCKRIGEGEFFEEEVSHTISPLIARQDRETKQISEKRVRRQVVLPSELMDIPYPSPETGLTGYYVIPSIGMFKHTYFPELWPSDDHVPNYVPRPVADQYPHPWDDDADYKRLNLTGPKPLPPSGPIALPEPADDAPPPAADATPPPIKKRKRNLFDIQRLDEAENSHIS